MMYRKIFVTIILSLSIGTSFLLYGCSTDTKDIKNLHDSSSDTLSSAEAIKVLSPYPIDKTRLDAYREPTVISYMNQQKELERAKQKPVDIYAGYDCHCSPAGVNKILNTFKSAMRSGNKQTLYGRDAKEFLQYIELESNSITAFSLEACNLLGDLYLQKKYSIVPPIYKGISKVVVLPDNLMVLSIMVEYVTNYGTKKGFVDFLLEENVSFKNTSAYMLGNTSYHVVRIAADRGILHGDIFQCNGKGGYTVVR